MACGFLSDHYFSRIRLNACFMARQIIPTIHSLDGASEDTL
jgi:hypothetical protein